MPFESIPARLRARAVDRGARAAYFVREPSGWVPTDFASYHRQVVEVARALVALGLGEGEIVCILGFNRPEWAVMDLAAMAIGGAAAGIYTTCSPPEVSYIVGHAESAVVLVEDALQWAKIEANLERLPKLRRVVFMRGAAVDHPLCLAWEAFLALGAEVPASEIDARIDALRADKLATLIYTSGTTGPPKGVMLTHDNLAWTADRVRAVIPVEQDESSLSYLPLSHIAEQMFTLHVPITYGYGVYFAESFERVPENLAEVQPTVVFGVPRVWEKMHAKVNAAIAAAPPLRQRLAGWAMAAGRARNLRLAEGKPVPRRVELAYKLADRVVLSKLRPRLGLGRARYAVSGAAPISPAVLEWFSGIGLNILEVYGQSEDTGPTTFNQPGRTRFGTVGPAVPGVEVRIAEDGEIVVRGRNVFAGYYKEPEATAATLVDGWLQSGDLGRFDEDGFLHITGRKKEIIITAGGKNVAPKVIEALLKDIDLVAEAVVIGDRRKYLVALLVLDPDAAAAWAGERGKPTDALHNDADLLKHLEARVAAEVNPQLAQVEQVKRIAILPRALTVEDGELTPSLKVKRRKVDEHFAAIIEGLYAG